MTRGFDEAPASIPRWKRWFYETIAAEISSFSRYYDLLLQWRPGAEDRLALFDAVVAPRKMIVREGEEFPDLSQEREQRTAVLLHGTFNYELDITSQLRALKPRLGANAHLVIVVYNAYLKWIYALATRLGLRTPSGEESFITFGALRNIAALSGYQIVRSRFAVYSPWRLLGLGTLLNRLLPVVPLVRLLGFVSVVTMRPVVALASRPSLTIVIPARNEAGNIERAIERLPELGAKVELIFVEGHSTDGTWAEIQRVAKKYADTREIKAFQQGGRGKNDAVRLGLQHATCDLVTILDADLTMPPELLVQFYDAFVEGVGEFVNGNRLIYPMEGEAMRPLNHLGNLFFAKALGWVMDQRIGDALCGTKLLMRRDYERIVRWRGDFGDFDPFGDFELLFGASILGLGIIEVPVRYRARTYGATSIHRFRDGLQLLNMTLIGFAKMKLGRSPAK